MSTMCIVVTVCNGRISTVKDVFKAAKEIHNHLLLYKRARLIDDAYKRPQLNKYIHLLEATF